MISETVLVMLMTAPQPEVRLPLCPGSPNCVSSQATGSHRIEPFALEGEAATAFARLRELLAQHHDATIIAADEMMIRVEFRTTLGFVDDALFILDAPRRLIQVFSAARTGYWDLGKNRRRLEGIRKEYTNRER